MLSASDSCAKQVKGTFRGQALQDSCLLDGDYTDGHYITLFAEQLTRTFEVIVIG